MASRSLARSSGGNDGRRAGRARRVVPGGQNSGSDAATPGTPGKHWVPPVGADAPFPLDEKVANPVGDFYQASRLDAGENRHFDLAVKLLLATRAGLFLWRDRV